MDIGVFLPIGNNGWLIATTSPQFRPRFEVSNEATLRVERSGGGLRDSQLR